MLPEPVCFVVRIWKYGAGSVRFRGSTGKGVPAALLASVLQGAIRSSTASDRQRACARINSMLCERTACERFATLFWGVFDPASGRLHYVNAGHAAPMLVRNSRIERLQKGGPVPGMLPMAVYSAGSVEIEAADTLVLYSDGINEATNQRHQEFVEKRIEELVSDAAEAPPAAVCERIMNRVAVFASTEVPQDDRTLRVVRYPRAGAALPNRNSRQGIVGAAA
jgi:sigma-B regulation protein RsbU (phosphoserine phosphatase)